MTPPPGPLLRLSHATPRGVGDEVLRVVLAHARRFIPTLEPNLAEGSALVELQRQAEEFTVYAQTGMVDGVLLATAGARPVLWNLCAALYGCAAEPDADVGAMLATRANTKTELGLVLVAGRARIDLGRGQPVSAKALAVLAGMSERHVRGLLGGELPVADVPARPRLVTARGARRWLASRGVAGFAAPT